jgi:hypothetical protein
LAAPDVGDDGCLPGEQGASGRTDEIADTPQRQRRGFAVLQEREQQQEAADNGDEQRHRKQRRHVEGDMGSDQRRHCIPTTAARVKARRPSSSFLRRICRFA